MASELKPDEKKAEEKKEKESGEGTVDEGWAALLHEILRSFLLIRDVVGYLLPGGLAIFLLVHGYGARLIAPLTLESSPWVLVPVLAGLSYLAGQIVVSLGYGLQGQFIALAHWTEDPMLARDKDPEKLEKLQRREERRRTSQTTAWAVAYYRSRVPKNFAEVDHQSTVAMLRTGIGGALMVGAFGYAWRALNFWNANDAAGEWSSVRRAALLIVGASYMLMSAREGTKSAANTRKAMLLAARSELEGTVPELPFGPKSALAMEKTESKAPPPPAPSAQPESKSGP